MGADALETAYTRLDNMFQTSHTMKQLVGVLIKFFKKKEKRIDKVNFLRRLP